MIQKFDDYIFDKKMEYLLNSIDETLSFENFKDMIDKFLPNLKTKEQAKKFTLNITSKFKPKKVLFYYLIKMIMFTTLLTSADVFDLFKGTQYEPVVIEYRNFTENLAEKSKKLLPKEEFVNKLFHKESSGRANIIKSDKKGKHVYIGGFQLSKKALKDVGFGHVTADKFRENPNIFPYEKQVEALFKYMKKNEYYLRNFKDYIDKDINGIKITKSGMLAAAHLVGQGMVKRFLRSGGKVDPTDGLGTKCSTYLKEFGGYDID